MILLLLTNYFVQRANVIRGTLKNGEISEASIQASILEWASIDPIIKKYRRFIIHFPNEGKRTRWYGAHLNRLGMRRGVSDIFIAVPRHGFGGAWIELKSKNGKLTDDQIKFIDDMKSQNYYTEVCRSFEEAQAKILAYLQGL